MKRTPFTPCHTNGANRQSSHSTFKNMKKLKILLIVTAVLSGSASIRHLLQRTDRPYPSFATSPTTVRFERDTLHLGTVRYGTHHEAVFRFVNTGTSPLLIRNALPTCGCTSVNWEKRPVAPGESGEIKTIFTPNSLGVFMKNIEVQCNVPENRINLKICGDVTE